MSQVAKGEFAVSLQPLALEGAEPEWKLNRMSIDKQISGDLVGSSKGAMLSAMTAHEGLRRLLSPIERVSGALHGRRGIVRAAAHRRHESRRAVVDSSQSCLTPARRASSGLKVTSRSTSRARQALLRVCIPRLPATEPTRDVTGCATSMSPVEQLRTALAGLPGTAQHPSRFGSGENTAWSVAGREFAHLHADDLLDLRLPLSRAVPACAPIRGRTFASPPRSGWSLSFTPPEDVAHLATLARIAWDAAKAAKSLD